MTSLHWIGVFVILNFVAHGRCLRLFMTCYVSSSTVRLTLICPHVLQSPYQYCLSSACTLLASHTPWNFMIRLCYLPWNSRVWIWLRSPARRVKRHVVVASPGVTWQYFASTLRLCSRAVQDLCAFTAAFTAHPRSGPSLASPYRARMSMHASPCISSCERRPRHVSFHTAGGSGSSVGQDPAVALMQRERSTTKRECIRRYQRVRRPHMLQAWGELCCV